MLHARYAAAVRSFERIYLAAFICASAEFGLYYSGEPVGGRYAAVTPGVQ